jgi:outer membrane protein assembly factor BamB
MEWSATTNVRWQVALQGAGVSAAVVCGGRVFLTGSDGRLSDRLHVFCYHTDDGRLVWHTRLFGSALPEGQFPPGGMAVPTAAADGKHVYALFGTGDLACLDIEGRPVWVRSLAQEYAPFRNRWGMASSPILVGRTLVVQVDHWGGSYLLGVDADTGGTRWRTPRDASVNWSSPLPVRVGGRVQLAVTGTYQVKGYDLETGKELWSVDGMQMQCIPSPVASDGLLLAVSGRDHFTLAIRLDGGTGDLTRSQVAWKAKAGGTFVPSPVCLGGRYYYVEDNGLGSCLEVTTGKRLWRERMGGAKYSASLVAGDGKVYFTSEEGLTTVVRAGPEFELLAKNELREKVVATPAVAGGLLYVRGEQHLFCIETGKAAEK